MLLQVVLAPTSFVPSIKICNMHRFVKKCWRGEERLWKVFWIWNFAAGIVLSLITEMVSLVTLFPVALQVAINKNLHGITFSKAILAMVGLSAIVFFVVYSIWALVSLWRSAFTCSQRIYGYFARYWVVMEVIVFPALAIVYPNSFFGGFKEEDIIIGPAKIEIGKQGPPSASKWSEIVQGIDKQDVEQILGSPPLKIDRDDGISIWSYWSYEYKEDDDPILLMIPWGKVCTVYFDSSQKVCRKKVQSISKEEALKKKEQIEQHREETGEGSGSDLRS